MKTLQFLTCLFLISSILIACKSDDEASVKQPSTPSPSNQPTLSWVDNMSDGFANGWNQDLSGGGKWQFDAVEKLNWSIINNSNNQATGRAEVSRRLTTFTNTDKLVTVKGKFKMAFTAEDNKPNEGGWVIQTMAWGYRDPNDSIVYKPLVVARILADRVDYLVYDYIWDSPNKTYRPKTGFPVSRIVRNAITAGQTFELALTINFSKNSTGYVKANLNGVDIPAANYVGATYPAIFPQANVQWKGGTYSSYQGEHYSKIGVYYLATDQPQ